MAETLNENLVPGEEDSAQKALSECQAHVGALTMLLIEHGVFTEHDFKCATARTDRYIEERREKLRAQKIEDVTHELTRYLGYVKREVLLRYPTARVNVLLPVAMLDTRRDGIYIRIVEPGLAEDSLVQAEIELGAALNNKFSQTPFAAYLFPLTIMFFTPASADLEPLALRFSALQRRAMLQTSSDC